MPKALRAVLEADSTGAVAIHTDDDYWLNEDQHKEMLESIEQFRPRITSAAISFMQKAIQMTDTLLLLM